SMAFSGTSARCTSSATTCLPNSSAERSLNAVPALTKGVRRPATIATRRPGREAIGTSGEGWSARGITALTQRVNHRSPDRRRNIADGGRALLFRLESAGHDDQHIGFAARRIDQRGVVVDARDIAR